MNNPAPSPAPRKRLLLLTMLTTVVLTVAWVTYFLVNFDLNDYRQQAEEKLSSLLSLPVKIGDIHYNLHDTRLALHVSNLEIGDSESAIQINAPSNMINLQWRGLLERDFRFAKISLDQPQISVRPAINTQSGDESSLPKSTLITIDQALLHKISIKSLEILGGVVHIKTSRPDQALHQIDITGLDGELSDMGLNRLSLLAMKGDLKITGQEKKSPWQLQGKNTLELGENKTLVPHFNLDLTVKTLDLRAVRELFHEHFDSFSMKGISDLHLHFEGSPDQSIDFQTELSSNHIALLPGPAYAAPILFKRLLVSGQLRTHGDHPGINSLSLQVDDSRLAGRIGWAPSGQPFSTTVTLLNSSLTVPQIKKWLPDRQESWQAVRMNILDQGSIRVNLAKLTLLENPESQKEWRVDQLKGEIQKVSWDNGKTPRVEITSLPFDVAGKLWQINNGHGRWGSLQLSVNGAGERNKSSMVLTSLDFTGEGQAKALIEEWQIPQQPLSTSGKLSFGAHLEGPPDQLSLDLQANLSQLSISHPAGLKLTPGPEDKLTLHATLTPEKVSLDHGAIKWSVAKGHISGDYFKKSPDDLSIDAFLTIDDLARLAETLPFLERLQLRGQADLSLHQKGLPASNGPEITLTLRDAGLRATRYIADLSQINGRVQVTTTGLVAENLRVHLGESPLLVQARVEDFSNPQLLLDAKAASIRADDLIFYSDKIMLRDVNGHLKIDKDGLTFSPVDVHLDGGTKASVRGTISFHAPFDVQLDIASEFARISEVIGLWTNRSKTSKERSASIRERTEDTKPKATVKINALVKQGDLYGMSFHDASAIIVPTHERLSIHPLDFSVGEGFCNAQVLTDFSRDQPTLLRISGHAQDVDALEVYQELLNQKNIVRGKLRGDFYLNGEIGPNYLPSSYGHFNIQIHDGVLHQFSFLSKVFSLLNVSQIFALQLPDMDNEGMPFDLLSANFHLDKGILRSEDLKIQSEAMNQAYIGQFNLIEKEVDFYLAIHPLGTVDKIVSRIPVAGWLLTGDDKALLTAHFSVKGKTDDVSVTALPLGTITGPTFGLLKRTLGLPFKLIEDPQILWGGDGTEK